MECLLTLCVYLTAGLGTQSGHAFDGDSYKLTGPKTNEYGLLIGEVALNAQKWLLYSELRHISGISTSEGDLGLNTGMAGMGGTYKGVTVRGGFGWQTRFSSEPSNAYGNFVGEVSAMYEFQGLFEGFFVKAAKLDDMENIIFGMIKRF